MHHDYLAIWQGCAALKRVHNCLLISYQQSCHHCIRPSSHHRILVLMFTGLHVTYTLSHLEDKHMTTGRINLVSPRANVASEGLFLAGWSLFLAVWSLFLAGWSRKV